MRRLLNPMLAIAPALFAPRVVRPIRYTVARVGRNEPCPCGSGKKFKRCCLPTTPEGKFRGFVKRTNRTLPVQPTGKQLSPRK